jgi:hypothetical protein
MGALAALVGLFGVAGAAAQPAEDDQALTEIKEYLTGQVDQLVTGSANLNAWAEDYYALAEASGFDYQAMWEANGAELPASLEEARTIWTDEANAPYESSEGLVAGVPSLAHFDVWIDAGPTAEEDPANAYDWTLELPDGQRLEKPGNLFHSLTEPTLWGTDEQFVGLAVDFNGNGAVELGEALPDANAFLGQTRALVDASQQLQTAVAEWQPTLSDAFTALVVMIPTANGYFEQWRLSPFVSGDATDQAAFVGASRLVDVLGIYGGLDLTWDNIAPLVRDVDPALADQIQTGMDDLLAFVQDIYDQERAGTKFTPEQAEQFGREVQTRADAVAGNIAQAAALLEVDLASV